jgi:hypothetical protein
LMDMELMVRVDRSKNPIRSTTRGRKAKLHVLWTSPPWREQGVLKLKPFKANKLTCMQ